MCGIAGIREFNGRVDEALVDDLRDALAHRGPDDRASWVSPAGTVGLGHRRLTILDLSSAGRQPMTRDGARVIHNGEMYNFRAVRRELEALGETFSTETDTEVILAGYRRWGTDVMCHFRGMFATAIHDEKTDDLHLFRDRIGVKPLYYALDGERLVFASELRAVMRHPGVSRRLDPDALSLYFKLQYVPAPWSIFAGVRKLMPGHVLTVDRSGAVIDRAYWNVFDCYRQPVLDDIDEEEAVEELERRLHEAFSLRLVSDVPVGVFLSGGVDSTTLVALLQSSGAGPVSTFTVGFPEPRYDESEDVRRVVAHLGTDHHEVVVDTAVARDTVPKLPELYDEPFGDASGVPTHIVSTFARQHVKVALSADGGDELFLGYRHYQTLAKAYPLFARARALVSPMAGLAGTPPVRGILRRAGGGVDLKLRKLRQTRPGAGPMTEFYFSSRSFWTDREIASLVTSGNGGREAFLAPFRDLEKDVGDFPRYMRAADTRSLLPDNMLVKVDRASMAASLEAREPFLDHKVIEWVARLPQRLLVRGGVGKHLLRRVLHRHVPPHLLNPAKRGFAMPLDVWLRGELRPLLTDYVNEARVTRDGVLDWPVVKTDLDDFLGGRMASSSRIWLVLEYLMWRERWC